MNIHIRLYGTSHTPPVVDIFGYEGSEKFYRMGRLFARRLKYWKKKKGLSVTDAELRSMQAKSWDTGWGP